MMEKVKKYFPHVLFILFLILLILVTHKDYGIAWDEKFYLDVGKFLVIRLLNFLKVNSNLVGVEFTPIMKLQLQSHGVVFDVIGVILTLFFKKFTFENYHLIRALMAVLIFILVAIIVEQLLNRRAALAAMILLLLFPRFYGEIYQNSIDVAATFFTALLVSYFIYFIKSNQSFWKQTILGLVTSLAINQRLVLGYLLILNVLTILIIDISKKKPFLSLIGKILVICLSTFVFMHLTNPYLMINPIKGLYDMVAVSKNFPWLGAVLFDGKLIWAYELPWDYLPKSILISVPATTLALFFIGFFDLIYRFSNEKKEIERKWLSLYLLLILIIPIILVWILKSTLYNSWRQFLFLTLPIIIIAAFGYDRLNHTKIRFIGALASFLIIIGLVITAKEMIDLHPYQYIYYNFLVGGLKGAYRRYETEYNGSANKEAVEWFNAHVNKKERQYKIISMGDRFSALYYLKENTTLTERYEEADYAISFARPNFDGLYPGRVIHTIYRKNTPLVYIKETTK